MQTARSVQTHLCIHTPVAVLPAEHPAPSGAPSEQTTETNTSSALQLTFFRRSLSVIACSCLPVVELTGHRPTDQISFFPRSEPFSLPIRRRDQCLYRFSFLVECGKKFVRPLRNAVFRHAAQNHLLDADHNSDDRGRFRTDGYAGVTGS